MYTLSPTILLSDARGIYIPRDAVDFLTNDKWIGFDKEDLKHLSDPKNDHYWETWDLICNNARFIDEQGKEWVLYQNGDLFAIPPIESMSIQAVLDFYYDDSIHDFDFTDDQKVNFLLKFDDDVNSQNVNEYWEKYIEKNHM